MVTMVQLWEPAPQQVALAANEVHLWRASLEVEDTTIHQLYPLLNSAEQDRAGRFRFERDRRRFIVARANLRKILSCYLNRNAQDICFVYGPHGKPALGFEQNEGNIKFNLSHAKGWAIYAIIQHHEIGVDIEAMQPKLSWQNLVERFFSEDEKALIQQTPKSIQRQLFFQAWTRKEAVLKAIGCGLSLSPECIEVALAAAPSTYLAQASWGAKGNYDLSLYDIKLASNYVGALAIEHNQLGMQFRHYIAPSLSEVK
ncbi:4'-phosphopantetheinyl transferase superfamily protein [Leptolyngbya sp. CCNP1308]|uniref:4'-phosphopantetheinyl transferase family protein n=1 Tax=Leptolyngbya sp. CCNP1308 TaxID=3110255 RepID=UPI002B21FE79|nr:4'-phosphopantetheinyl transferase superfamily protein [Leptolyngbya sp. CCNP1308]MEA5452793.1 4'-phosphopantetheinyl transferase superfamily protein [Leptolyngbya sp. CCNP1308]